MSQEEKTAEQQTAEEKAVEEKAAEEKQGKDWDKVQQTLDQEKSNRVKATVERDAMAEQLSTSQTKIEALEAKITSIAEAKELNVVDLLDSDLVDPSTIKAVTKLSDELRAARDQVTELSQFKTSTEQRFAKADVDNRRKAATDKILTKCDNRYGAKYRNDAFKLANELVKSGNENQPQNEWDGLELMEKCYEQVKTEADKTQEDPKTLVTDTGGGGVPFDDTKVKTGSHEDVLADMKKNKGSWQR